MWQVLIVAFSRCFQNAVVMGEGRLLWWSREPGSHRSLGSSSSVDPRILPQATFFNRRFGWGVSLPHRLPHFMPHIVVAALLVDTSPCPPAAPTAHRRSLSSFCDQWSPANNSDQWSEGWYNHLFWCCCLQSDFKRCKVEPSSLLLELVGMETRSGAHGRRPSLSETKEGEILSQDQQQRVGEVPPIMLVSLKNISVDCVGISEEEEWENHVRSKSVCCWCNLWFWNVDFNVWKRVTNIFAAFATFVNLWRDQQLWCSSKDKLLSICHHHYHHHHCHHHHHHHHCCSSLL